MQESRLLSDKAQKLMLNSVVYKPLLTVLLRSSFSQWSDRIQPQVYYRW